MVINFRFPFITLLGGYGAKLGGDDMGGDHTGEEDDPDVQEV